jgi:RimJ/RimL family protein N-acetyltransferase
MLQLDPRSYADVEAHFSERPGPLCGPHVIGTGRGALFADRWPEPRAVLAAVAGNYALRGDPTAVRPDWLQDRLAGFVDAPEAFAPLLREAFPDLKVWDRVVLALADKPRAVASEGAELRRIGPRNAHHVWALAPDIDWISKTWGGPPGLAASGLAFGAFVEDRLASLAVPFFVGSRYEDVGIVTDTEFRGRGLSPACAAAVAVDVSARGRRTSWSTSPENAASLRVAHKLGFEVDRRDVLYLVDEPAPKPASKV